MRLFSILSVMEPENGFIEHRLDACIFHIIRDGSKFHEPQIHPTMALFRLDAGIFHIIRDDSKFHEPQIHPAASDPPLGAQIRAWSLRSIPGASDQPWSLRSISGASDP